MGSLKAGSAAPAFTLEGIEGRSYSLQKGGNGAPVLLAFFKVSCPTCQFTFPFIERVHQQFRDHGIQVWGVSQDNAKDSRGFAEEFGLTFPILVDPRPYRVSDTFGLEIVPTMFLIDVLGQIVLVTEGFDKKDIIAIHRWLAEFTAANPPPLFLPNERVPEYKPG